MSSDSAPALIIHDGGFAGSLAAHLEGVCRLSGGESGAGAGSVLWLDLSSADPSEHDRRRAAARRCADACQLADLLERDEPPAPWATDHAGRGGLALTHRLLAAGAEAIRLGLLRLVWPVQLGGPGRGTLTTSGLPADRVDAVADATDRALAVARLLSLDAPGDGLTIETPFADLTDIQLADLAVEIDLPASLAFLGERDGPEMARWTRAFHAVGVPLSDLLAVTPIVRARSTEPGRAV